LKIEGFDGKFQVTGEEREKQPETTTPVKRNLPLLLN